MRWPTRNLQQDEEDQAASSSGHVLDPPLILVRGSLPCPLVAIFPPTQLMVVRPTFTGLQWNHRAKTALLQGDAKPELLVRCVTEFLVITHHAGCDLHSSRRRRHLTRTCACMSMLRCCAKRLSVTHTYLACADCRYLSDDLRALEKLCETGPGESCRSSGLPIHLSGLSATSARQIVCVLHKQRIGTLHLQPSYHSC